MEGSNSRTYGITLDTAQDHLEAWMEAEMMVTTHQSYQLGSRTLTRADLGEIRKTIDYWDAKVKSLSGTGGGRARRVILRDL